MQFITGMMGLSTRRALYFLLIHKSNLTASVLQKELPQNSLDAVAVCRESQ